MCCFISFLLLFLLTTANCDDSVVRLPREATSTFNNPLNIDGPDPWIIPDPYGNGYYFCATTTWDIKVAHCKTPGTLGEPKVVFTPPEGSEYSKHLWAPELHYINGEWYIYFSAHDDYSGRGHRMYVLKGTSQNPTEPFEFVGKIPVEDDMWAIDGSILRYKDELYVIFSGGAEVNGEYSQNIYIAHMANPWTVDGKNHLLSYPEYDWERHTAPDLHCINEGPEALYKNDKIHIVYSASFSQLDEYCLGLLTFKGGDILDRNNWVKHPAPIFTQAEKAYGPGHNGFFKTPDGKDWIVYHANLVSGNGWFCRSTRIQPVMWRGDMPYLGTPAHPDETIKITYKKDKYTYNVASEILHEKLFDWFK